MTEREPDCTPVTRDHIRVFLDWYRARAAFPRYAGVDEHWWNALKTLTLGELRNGMKILDGLAKPVYMNPPEFWHRCKSIRSPQTAARWKATREILKTQEMKR